MIILLGYVIVSLLIIAIAICIKIMVIRYFINYTAKAFAEELHNKFNKE